MKVINIPLHERSYDILIESGLPDFAERVARLVRRGETAALISDENVFSLYGEGFAERLKSRGVSLTCIVVPPGEGSKNLVQLARLYDRLAEAGVTRGGLIIAFGGGVVGDLAGFAASSYMRGVDYVQIPTTLLAQVDSSVGGKTAVDIPAGKNLVGAFYQPKLVVIDPSVLSTLPPREFVSGMAEVVKYGAIASERLFAQLEQNARDGVFARCVTRSSFGLSENGKEDSTYGSDNEFSVLEEIIAACCEIKSGLVAEDERDTGRRAILNFGHSFGHAIEKKYGFSGPNHGEAVAAGMRIAARLGERLGVTEAGTASRIENLLDKIGLCTEESASGLLSDLRRDKKSTNNGIHLILLRKIGEAVIVPTKYELLEELLDD